MEARNDDRGSTLDLRRRAEELVRNGGRSTSKDLELLSHEEVARLIHELSVHQVELELQNEELRSIQENLEKLRARYFDLYDLAPVGYCILSMEGLVLEANLTAAIQLGLPRVGLVKQRITRFIVKEDQDLYYLNRKHFLETGEPFDCELRMRKDDGEVFWVHLTSSSAPESEEDPKQGVKYPPLNRLIMTDITARKEAEKENAKLEEKLRQVKKLQTLGILAGGVAHDFNNLLAAIMGNANLGSLSAEPGSNMAKYFRAIETASMRAAGLTGQLLAYAGKGKYSVMEVDLDIIVKEVQQVLSVSVPECAKVDYDLADRLPFVKGDPTQVLQVIMNLVTNASEAISKEEGGTITIRTSTECIPESGSDSSGWILPVLPGHYATLEVSDTGAGMAPEILALAFDPFFSTKFTGRGLGLAAVLGILGSHNGGIKVWSEPGRGSSFKLFLPAMQGARLSPGIQSTFSRLGEGRLLVADDDRAVRSVVREMAEQHGFSTIEAASDSEAVELYRLHHEELSLVLLDLSISHLNGREPFSELKQIDLRIPVVITGDHDAPAGPEKVAGTAGFLKKPYRAAEFCRVLQRSLAQREAAFS